MKIVSRVSKVDKSKCIGCRSCERHCPTGAIKVRVAKDGKFTAPCKNACPAGIDVPGYIALAGAGEYEKAYRLIRKNNPFPSVCGRVCTHECQFACNRSNYDDPVAIRDIKRFVSDHTYENGKFPKETVWPSNGKKVAVIGAGPSGLTCAYYLALTGYQAEVFESEDKAGGVLLYGIPEYRLPKDILARDVQGIIDAGVNVHLGMEVGKDINFDQLRKDFDAVYISTGTQFSRHANIKGEDLPGVYHGLDFLRSVSNGEKPEIGKKVVVIGGGNTAIDVSRTAVRLGADEVTILYRRRQVDMPADNREIIEAFEEGVKLVALASPIAIEGDGKVQRIRANRMEIGDIDDKGRRSTHSIPDDEFYVDADSVIVAVSQYSDFPFIDKDEVQITEFGKLVLDENNMTTMEGVFAGGDVARGSATAIQAIADGKAAAIRINEYLGMAPELNDGEEIKLPPRKDFDWFNESGCGMRNLPISERIHSDKEVACGLSEEEVRKECRRCYRCTGTAEVDEQHCIDCQICWEYCDQGAITMEYLPEERHMSYKPPHPDRTEEVLEICRKSWLYPTENLCVCTATSAEEVISAIFDGAHTFQEVSRMTGIRGGCSLYCVASLTRLLTNCGYPPEASKDNNFYPMPITLWNLPDEVADHDPKFHMREVREAQFNDELFEAEAEKYRKLMEERRTQTDSKVLFRLQGKKDAIE